MTTAPFAAAQVATPSSVDCAGIQEYLVAYKSLGVEYTNAITGIDTSALQDWTEAEFQQAAAAVDDALNGLRALEPPAIAAEAHGLATEGIAAFGELLDTIETAGVFGVLAFIEKFEDLEQQLAGATLEVELACKVAYYDHDDDGQAEIGTGTLGTPPAQGSPGGEQPLGAVSTPYPLNAAFETVDGWNIKVLSVTPDATEAVLAENSFNEEPEPGRQYLVATISATYNGKGTDSFDGNFRLRAQGIHGVYEAFNEACGDVPNEWDEDIVVSSGEEVIGNLCWSVPAEEVPYLVMFDDDALDAEVPQYWSLVQSDGLSTPLPVATSES